MGKSNASIYQFRVSLLDTDPEIWRIIEVPKSYTFWDLHVAIQDSMGWLDYHLHEFVPTQLPGSTDPHIGIPESPMDDEYVAGWEIPITQHLASPGDVVRYEYDFGDGWSHEVRLVAIERKAHGVKYPRCIGGERAALPRTVVAFPDTIVCWKS